MCELTVVNTHQELLNQLTLYQLVINSSKVHKDGFGVWCNGRTNKTKIQARIITNAGKVLLSLVGPEIAFAHIRQASRGVVDDSNAHPFETSDFVVFHNGTLEYKEPPAVALKSNNDSEAFSLALQADRDAFPDMQFSDLLCNTYKKFRGKFAFLIYDKKNKDHYAIRGKTAKLYISYLSNKEEEVIGYLINTDQDNLNSGALYAQNVSQLLGCPLVASECVEIPEGSINLLQKDSISMVGKIEEEDIPYVYAAAQSRYGRSSWYGVEYSNEQATMPTSASTMTSQVGTLLKLATVLKMSSHQMNILSYMFLGKFIVELNEGDVDDLVKTLEDMVPNVSTLRYVTKKMPEGIPMDVYEKGALVFPWFINPQKDIIKAIKDVISVRGTESHNRAS